ncbi:MAG: cardiolipin synthase [Lachnospiraceae bacterium]|nr:cardiolipin synthase [Lachnospiraceae bacterium]
MSKNNGKSTTLESEAKTKNGVKRMVFSLVAIGVEVVFIFFLLTKLQNHAAWIEIVLHLLVLLLVLGIYAMDMTSSMKMPWIILILTVPVLGTVLYLLVGLNGGTHKMRKRYEDLDRRLLPLLSGKDGETSRLLGETDPAAAGISFYLRTNSGYPVWQNTDVVYYDDAAKGLEAQLADLDKAEKFIFMEYHAIEDKTSWKRIEDVLVRKVAQGVEVRVFYDDMGSIGFITTDFVKKLEGLGIACRVFNPFLPFLNLFLNNRDHRKITVVDGKVGYTGGYNLADEYFNLTHPYGQWKDTGIRLEGDAVQSLTVTFLEMWNAGRNKIDGREDADFGKYLPHYEYRAVQNGFIQPYADSPMDDKRVGEDVYISMAEKAERYCYFVTPYLIVTDEMTHALTLAAKRGVDVRIVTPGIPDKKMVYSVTRSFYPALVKHGVRIYEWTPGFCHCKMSVADDKMATCGTINLDYRSLYHHFENGCWMYDSAIAASIRDDFYTLFDESCEVTEKYREGKNSFMKISQLFLRLFAELL